ncbi:rod-binding protein [Beijerinckia sp. L45]|uniref:rod-binding protein n=1 Tax=Beijerinckia sp. L45 TaxID=1641855 RepID=UPI00131DDE57|nr:rod-binding protein [Beijerinckia sp. L45]
MAISPPSDIVLDVASAADPAKVRAATERLAKLAADPTATISFSDALASTKSPAVTGSSTPAPTTAAPAGFADARDRMTTAGPHDKLKAYQKFEAVLLQNFVESILPKDDELFGDKNSADIYRSMMAEQFANQLAKSGSLGIAKQIMAAHPPGSQPTAPISSES